ncbi:nucleoside transporter [Desulfolutivibrio sp.]|uniref:nucleoside transporter n=1 Tax=Desulfolutivibrio sp. TaxID=2773296 RepID=UPI002F961D97
MSATVFLIIFIVLGFVVLAYFSRRSKNFAKRHPGEKNPIDFWLYGKDRKDDDES